LRGRHYSTESYFGPPDGPKNKPTKKRLTEAQKAAIVILLKLQR